MLNYNDAQSVYDTDSESRCTSSLSCTDFEEDQKKKLLVVL